MAKAFQKIYDDLNYPLIWPNVLIINRGIEFLGEYRNLLLTYSIKIQYANFKCNITITKHDYQEFEKYTYFQQDTIDFYLPLTKRSKV